MEFLITNDIVIYDKYNMLFDSTSQLNHVEKLFVLYTLH